MQATRPSSAGSSAGGATRRFDHRNTQRDCVSCHNGLTAVGKGARAAKTEIEKYKFEEKSVEEALGLVPKMYCGTQFLFP